MMGLFNRERKGIAGEAVEATARITDLEQHHLTGKAEDGDSWFWEDALEAFGKSKYTLELEVTVPGQDPYRVRGSFKVPAKAERTGLTRASLSKGLELPVRVDPHDRQRVEINWDRFAAAPERKRALEGARESRQAELMRAELAKKPKLQARLWEQNKLAAAAWTGAVQAGNMSREEFERTVQLEVDNGRMNPDDADAARQALDG